MSFTFNVLLSMCTFQENCTNLTLVYLYRGIKNIHNLNVVQLVNT